MALETIISRIKRYSLIGLASFSVGCSNCDDGDKIVKVPCIDYEICGNYDLWGNPLDDDCNGKADDGCDADGDGFCAEKVRLYSQQSQQPSICEKTFKKCLENPDLCADGVYDCTKTYNYLTNGTCQFFSADCNDDNYDINPDALEICDGINNNCRLGTDESFPESALWCDGDGNLFENYSELPGICELGNPTCKNGAIICPSYIGPQEQEHCNRLDDDCKPETKDILLTDARECYTGPSGTKGVGICMGGVEVCINGVVGGDGICHGEQLPQEEKCNCLNDDCDKDSQGNELIDEWLYTAEKLNISMNFDTSDSMDIFYSPLARLAETENVLLCASSDKVKIS
ncbi:MAG: putative metal-binding motif-containing protein, partial [Nanoarchaeota archaeon]|nr:putative metal-binding motif-containing protein [Nanoarchaeota archaeon]